MREGIDDCRYWLTLRQMVAAAEQAGGRAPDDAVQVLADVEAAGAPGADMYPARPLSAAECQRLRERIVRAIGGIGGIRANISAFASLEGPVPPRREDRPAHAIHDRPVSP